MPEITVPECKNPFGNKIAILAYRTNEIHIFIGASSINAE
jgi:hypothetical protein